MVMQRKSAPARPSLFFFQAEDGIRDYKVTGVQTCALPICSASMARALPQASSACAGSSSGAFQNAMMQSPMYLSIVPWKRSMISLVIGLKKPRRSEERRVGKECRSRWSLYEYKEKDTSDDA